jgi:hypothetical protein
MLPADMVRKRLEREGLSARGGSSACVRRLRLRYEIDLLGFLNGATVHELRALAAAVELPAEAPAGALRQRLWSWGAALERRVVGEQALGVQPAPVLSSAGRLSLPRRRAVDEGRCRRRARPAFRRATAGRGRFPRRGAAPAQPSEPESLEELLARAGALLGVRLGGRDADKGAYGRRISQLLGIGPSSSQAPDWRGEVELKTLAVTRAGGARWRLKDGPAISMRSVEATAKLARVLWIVRVDEREVAGAPVLSWYYQELDADLTAALERSRHLRRRGAPARAAAAGTCGADYFEACGLLRSLNG